MSEEVKTNRCEIAKSEQGWVVNYKDNLGRTAIVAVISKTEYGCRAALFKSGHAEPCVTMETMWSFDGTFRIVRKAIRGLMSKIGKNERKKLNRQAKASGAADEAGRLTTAGEDAKAKEVAQ